MQTGGYTLRALATQDLRIEYFMSGPTCWYNRRLSEQDADPVHVVSGATTAGVDLVDCSG